MKKLLIVSTCFLFFDFLVTVYCFNPGYNYHESQREDCFVEIENGKVRGHLVSTSHGREMCNYFQIPYATPPVGNLRFKKPLPPQNWTGIIHETEITKTCWETNPLKESNNPLENEDCLYLNVHTPKLPSQPGILHPVAFYLYGGRFTDGSNLGLTPQLFVEADVIFVSFNFRSGVFGFLSTEDGILPPNLGLEDQYLALIWVQRNIRYFGGDPSKVTIIGHSSGASCVAYHIARKSSAGLFRSAIVQSGNGLSDMNVMSSSQTAYEIAKSLSKEFTEKNSTLDIYNLFMKTPASELANLTIDANTFGVGPVTTTGDEDTFLKEPLYENLLRGKFNKIPLMTGITSEEILGIEIKDRFEMMAKQYDENPETVLAIKGNRKTDYFNALKCLYTNSTYSEDLPAFGRMLSDTIFGYATITQGRLHSMYCKTFFYVFSFVGELNNFTRIADIQIPGLTGTGAGHADELPYFVLDQSGTNFKDEWKFKTETLVTRYRIATLWTNFIKYGHPTPVRDSLLQNIIWPEFSTQSLQYLDIDRHLSIKANPRNYTRWLTQIFDKYYAHPINLV